MRPEELETLVITMRELGASYDDTVRLMSGVTKDVKSLSTLWGKPSAGGQKPSRLIKIGVSMIAFPVPIFGINKILGASLIAAGLIQERIKHLHVADVYSTFQELNMELQKLRQKTIE